MRKNLHLTNIQIESVDHRVLYDARYASNDDIATVEKYYVSVLLSQLNYPTISDLLSRLLIHLTV